MDFRRRVPNLAVSDKSLTEVLRRHREALGIHEQGDDIEDESEVTDLEGKRRIVDLMLSMRIPLARRRGAGAPRC